MARKGAQERKSILFETSPRNCFVLQLSVERDASSLAIPVCPSLAKPRPSSPAKPSCLYCIVLSRLLVDWFTCSLTRTHILPDARAIDAHVMITEDRAEEDEHNKNTSSY